MSTITKKALMMAFIRLANTMPIEKISVTQITEECGVNRNTFYYHYRDVYDLVENIVHTKSEKLFDPKRHDTMDKALLFAAEYAKKNHRFIKNVYNAVGADTFEEYLSSITHDLMQRFVCAEAKALSEKNGTVPSEAALRYAEEICALSFCAVALKWIKSDMRADPVQIMRRHLDATRGCLGVILRNISSV